MLHQSFTTLLSLLLSATLLTLPTAHAAQADEDLEFSLKIDGDEVHLDISALVEAKPNEVWSVMTDFDHMADFISNLKSSQVIARSGNVITVEQRGKAGSGPVSFSLDSVREVQIKPYEWIHSHLLSGAMKQFEGVTRISEEGGKTRVRYHSDTVSAIWIPPIIGRRLIESEAREQFTQMLQEVLRRKQQSMASR